MPLDLQQLRSFALHLHQAAFAADTFTYNANNKNNNNNGQLSAKSAQRMNFIFILFALHFYDCYANALCKNSLKTKTKQNQKKKHTQLQSGSATRRGIFCLVGVSIPRPTTPKRPHHKSATAETSPTRNRTSTP